MINEIITLIEEINSKILQIYETDFTITTKEDTSPLTTADLTANEMIVDYLRDKYPNHGILTEEEKDNKNRLNKDYVWIIDPIDGTKEFIKKNGEFTINIALTYRREPILGVISAPAMREIYFAEKNKGAFILKNQKVSRIKVSSKNEIENMTLAVSRSHISEHVTKLLSNFKNAVQKGSSLKGCLIANGTADAYFRIGYTNEWDICAMDIILREAGGTLTDLNNNVITYNNENTLIKGFIASNNKIHEKLLNIVKNG